ncbi:MAG: hypothetical protein EBR30_11550 [Cytophagia bacterium]|nr:hypothetical protein [Cytophagia bacterium]
MKQAVDKDLEKLKHRLNLILIAGLCSFTLAPCVIFYFRGDGKILWLLVFIALSYLVSRLPKSFYDRFQISQDTKIYRSLGVDKFKKFSTNGDYINRKIRKDYPGHRNVTNIQTVQDKLNETYTIEKSHTVLLVFCLLTTIYALFINSVSTAIIVFLGNMVFNFYPNLLQQYNRIRYSKVLNKFSPATK